MEAVQHWSQWRLQFEPKRQLITLHSLKIRRGQNEIDQSNLERRIFYSARKDWNVSSFTDGSHY